MNALKVTPIDMNLRNYCPQFYTFASDYALLYPFLWLKQIEITFKINL